MSFDTPVYVVFLLLTVLVHRRCPQNWRWALLLGCSLVFYACWSPALTLVILVVVALTWVCALRVERSRSALARRLWLLAAVLGCVGLLVWFKYFNFLGETFAFLTGGQWKRLNILLPVGCSFYTFQAMAYVADVSRGRLRAVRNPGHYALFVCFFPQLVAGPIERAEDLLPQLLSAKDADREDVDAGLRLLLSGYFRKLVIADMAATAVDRVFALAAPDGSAVALAVVLFSVQIYCDFAGYSEIAQGSARLLGVRLRRNFDRPYLAQTVRAFWRRWHISLSRWFTDYVYIPLGGSRRGLARQLLAILAVFLLSGLWHGADWTYVLWGLWHGLLCSAEVLLHRREVETGGMRRALQWLLTALAVLISWLWFRAESVAQAGQLLRCLLSPWHMGAGWQQTGLSLTQAACLALGLCQLPLLHRLSEGKRCGAAAALFLAAACALGWLARSAGNVGGAFIYFQF